jgi:organic radical activating enzyme
MTEGLPNSTEWQPMKARIDLDIGRKTFESGLLPELIAVLRGSRPGDLVAVIGDEESIGPALETWCRFTGNSLLEATVDQGRSRWVFRCGSVAAPAQENRSLGSRLWIYTNFDCNLHCDYCCVRSSPAALRRELGLVRVQRIAREAMELGVKEIFVTGGEPFLLENIAEILTSCAAAAPTTVLTNGTLLTGRRAESLRALARDRIVLQISLTARLQSGTISIADQEHGREHARVFTGLVLVGFGCDLQRLYRPMLRLRSSVNSSMTRRLRPKIDSSGESRCVVLPAKA